jgi:hypothetical protein
MLVAAEMQMPSTNKLLKVSVLMKRRMDGVGIKKEEAVEDEGARMAGLDHPNVLKALGISEENAKEKPLLSLRHQGKVIKVSRQNFRKGAGNQNPYIAISESENVRIRRDAGCEFVMDHHRGGPFLQSVG